MILTNERTPINGDMVILGRESRGLTQKMLADQLGVAQGTVSKIEAGLLPFPSDVVDRLSQVLNYPAPFFYQHGPLMGVGVAEVFHRKRQDIPMKVMQRIYAIIEVRIRHIVELLRSVEIPCNVRQIPISDYDGNAADIARLVRATWNLPRGPIQNLTVVLENAGIVVTPMDFGTQKVDAISRWVPGLPPLFFVNRDAPADRCRFSLAHELGHMVMHEFPTPDIEEEANRFAAEFLLPQREVITDFTDMNLAKLAQLKRYWKVSMAALLHRAQELQAVTANQARYMWYQMSRAGYRTREPAELDVKKEQPRLLHEIVEAHRKQLGYSVSDLSEMLRLFEREFRELYLQDRNERPLKLVPFPSDTTCRAASQGH